MTVLFCGIGLVAAGFAVIVAREVAGGIVVDQLVVNESVKPAAEETWSIATSLMTSIATTVIVVGVLFGVAGWLASPTGSARATRRVLAPALQDYPAYVYTGLAIIVAIYFLSAPTQNLRSFLTTLAIAGLAAFGIHELRRQAHEENPDASYDEFFGRTKDRMVGAVKSANLGERASKLRLPEVRRPDGGRGGRGRRRGNDQDARLERLERLGELHEKGVLSDEEFAAEKAKALGDDRRAPRLSRWRSRPSRWGRAPSKPARDRRLRDHPALLRHRDRRGLRGQRRDRLGDQPDRPDRPRRAHAESAARPARAAPKAKSTPARSKPKSKPCAAKPTSRGWKNRSPKTKNGSKNWKTPCAASNTAASNSATKKANSSAETGFLDRSRTTTAGAIGSRHGRRAARQQQRPCMDPRRAGADRRGGRADHRRLGE